LSSPNAPDAPGSRLSWAVEKRLKFLEFRLGWEGKLRRADLIDLFDISAQQASADIAKYHEIAPENLTYDGSAKTYVATASFHPVLGNTESIDYLGRLRSIADGQLALSDSWLGSTPPVAIVPTLARRVDAEALRTVLLAIRERLAIHVLYQSLSREEPAWRWLAPHALAFDGFRWHARAWCHLRQAFQDFIFARMQSVGETRPDDTDASRDLGWHRMVTLRIGPHPGLSPASKRAIELDYGMVNGELAVETRACFSFYLERRMGLDRDPDTDRPERQQIVLLNPEEVKRARVETGVDGP
jgi:hypothetical protein